MASAIAYESSIFWWAENVKLAYSCKFHTTLWRVVAIFFFVVLFCVCCFPFGFCKSHSQLDSSRNVTSTTMSKLVIYRRNFLTALRSVSKARRSVDSHSWNVLFSIVKFYRFSVGFFMFHINGKRNVLCVFTHSNLSGGCWCELFLFCGYFCERWIFSCLHSS